MFLPVAQSRLRDFLMNMPKLRERGRAEKSAGLWLWRSP
jgi:hypothetical protein